MKLHHHRIHNFRHYLKGDLSKFESFLFIHNIGRVLISIFLPIILYMEGFKVPQILIYLLCYGGFDLVLNLVAREFVFKFGAKNAIILALGFEIFYFVGLIFLQINWSFLIGLAFLAAVFDSFFYVAHWLIFNEIISRSKDVGNKIGMLNIVKSVASLITPVIGAMFLIFFNKNYLIGLSIILFCLSIIPLFGISVKHLKVKKKKNVFQMLKYKETRNNFFLVTLLGIHYQVEDILLPLFIFLTFSSIETVSFLPIILAMGSIVFNYFIGKFVDKHEKFRVIIFGALSLGIVWIVRLFFPMIETFFLSTIFVGFFANMVFVPLEAKLVKSSRHASYLDVSTQRNVAYMWLNPIFYLVLFLSIEVFEISFAVSAFCMFSIVLISQFLLRDKIKLLKIKEAKDNKSYM